MDQGRLSHTRLGCDCLVFNPVHIRGGILLQLALRDIARSQQVWE